MGEPKPVNFRHELKYLISSAEVTMLRTRLSGLISLDAHAKNGHYTIRSLYFDDYDDRCLLENENGTDPREKFRIRIYNGSADRISLECKRKERGMTHKTSCPLTREQTELLMAGKIVPNVADRPPLLQKLTAQMLTRRLLPVVIVEYERVPFVYRNGNVRITLDTNLVSSSDVSQFLRERIPHRPVMPLGQQLLEVKYDAYLPDFLYQSLQLSDLRHTALGVACLLALYIFFVYRVVTRKTFYSKNFNITLAGVTVITASLILTMQSSVVLSLGMVGALSIVRFRTAIKEPMDLMFLFWSISVGIICGAGLAQVAVILSVVMTLGILILDRLPVARAPMIFVVNADNFDAEDAVVETVRKYAKHYRIKSRNLAENSLDLVLELRTDEGGKLVREVMGLAGVTSASLLAHDGEVTF